MRQRRLNPPPESAVKRAARYASYFFWIMFFANFVNYLQRFIFIGLSTYIVPAT